MITNAAEKINAEVSSPLVVSRLRSRPRMRTAKLHRLLSAEQGAISGGPSPNRRLAISGNSAHRAIPGSTKSIALSSRRRTTGLCET